MDEPENEFLGLAHDLAWLTVDGTISFWPRQGLLDKVEYLLSSFEESEECTPADSSKFRGVIAFSLTVVYDRPTKAGRTPFIKRRCVGVNGWGTKPWRTSDSLKWAIKCYRIVRNERPRQPAFCRRSRSSAVVIASDAQVEQPGSPPGGGYLLYNLDIGSRRRAWAFSEDADMTATCCSF